MSKYIKLDETVNALIELEAKLGSQQQTKRGVRFAIGYVNDLPTIDIVRCKECIYYTPFDEGRPFDCPIGVVNTIATDFCSHGERKDNE